MSAISAVSERNGVGCLVPFAVIAVLISMMAIGGLQVVEQVHAARQHTTDAQQIRTCLRDNGPYQIFLSRDNVTYYLLCELPDGRWGLQAIVMRTVNGIKAWCERTAFVPNNGSWYELMRYLANIATRFYGTLN